MNRIWTVVVSILFMGVVLSLATIPDVSVPNTFTAGTKAVASEINANFDTLELYHNNLLDSLRARLKIDTIDAKYFDTVRSSYGDFTLFDTVRATYGDFTLFDTVRATYGDFTLFDTVRATYGDITTFDTVRATYGDITTFDTVRATYGDFTLFDTVRATYGDITTFDTVRATYGDITTFDTVRATYGDFTLQDTLKSNVIKGDSLTYIGNDTTRFVITKAGKVGIGTTTPGAKLDVNGDIILGYNIAGDFSVGKTFATTAAAANVPSNLLVGLYNGDTSTTFAGMVVSSVRNAGNTANDYTTSFNYHEGGVAAGTAMTITKAGNVGIDTTAPASKLHVAGSVRVRDTVICGTWNPTTVNATTMNATTMNATTADINGGAIDATTIGASTPAAGTFTTATASTLNITLLNIGSGTLRTLAGDSISVGNVSHINIDTEGGAALDTLSKISTVGTNQGDILIIRTTNTSRDVFVSEAGNIIINGSGSTIGDVYSTMAFMRLFTTNWIQLWFTQPD